MNMSKIIYAAEVNILREFINLEMERRDVAANATSTVSVGTIADDAWWNSLRTNLLKIVSFSGGNATAGGFITTSQRDTLVNQAVAAYDATIALP
jgi:hypothetical protein